MICIWSSWCRCHPIISCSSKIRNGLPFWCRLTQVVLEKRPSPVVMAVAAVVIVVYTSTCVSQHPQLRTGGFCWSKVLLPACPCWRHLAHSNYGENARVFLNDVTWRHVHVQAQCCYISLNGNCETVSPAWVPVWSWIYMMQLRTLGKCTNQLKIFAQRELSSSWDDRLATIDVSQKVGAAVPLFWWGRAGSPSNTIWPGLRPSSIPSFILIHPAVSPQYINVTDRQTTVWWDRAKKTVLTLRPKNYLLCGACPKWMLAVWWAIRVYATTKDSQNCKRTAKTGVSVAAAVSCRLQKF